MQPCPRSTPRGENPDWQETTAEEFRRKRADLAEAAEHAVRARTLGNASLRAPRRHGRALREEARTQLALCKRGLRRTADLTGEPGVETGRAIQLASPASDRPSAGIEAPPYLIPGVLFERLGSHVEGHLHRLGQVNTPIEEWQYRSAAIESYVTALQAIVTACIQAAEYVIESRAEQPGR